MTLGEGPQGLAKIQGNGNEGKMGGSERRNNEAGLFRVFRPPLRPLPVGGEAGGRRRARGVGAGAAGRGGREREAAAERGRDGAGDGGGGVDGDGAGDGAVALRPGAAAAVEGRVLPGAQRRGLQLPGTGEASSGGLKLVRKDVRSRVGAVVLLMVNRANRLMSREEAGR